MALKTFQTSISKSVVQKYLHDSFTETNLAALYSSEGSVMERHHLSQAMCILNTEGCDILESLPRRDYDRALMILRDYVLASDLANYFKLVFVSV